MIKQISESIYRLNGMTKGKGKVSFSYLIVNAHEAVLIDIGEDFDIDDVYQGIETVIDPKTIQSIIISQPCLDLPAKLKKLKARIGSFKIVTEKRTKAKLSAFDLGLTIDAIDEQDFQYTFQSGHVVRFIPAPFTPYFGAFLSFDTHHKVLFSGQLFSAIYPLNSVFERDTYLKEMSIFHQSYMPSSDFIRPVLKQLFDLEIDYIVPSLGTVISKENIVDAMNFLYHLDFYNPFKAYQKSQSDSQNEEIQSRLEQIIIRLRQMYSEDTVKRVFKDTQITVTFQPVVVKSNLKGYALWNRFFEIIYASQGDVWLSAIESLVMQIAKVYKLGVPQIYQLRIRKLEEKNRQITKTVEDLNESVVQMTDKVSSSEDRLRRCPITNLYVKDVLGEYLVEHLAQLKDRSYLVNLDIDQIVEINQSVSTKSGDDTILMLKYILSNELQENEHIFRGIGSSFLWLIETESEEEVVRRFENFRNLVLKSTQFIKPITISAGALKLESEDYTHPIQLVRDWFLLVESRLAGAKKNPFGVLNLGKEAQTIFYKNNLLLVDEEQINVNLITQYMEREGYRVYHAINPIDAMKIIEERHIDLIISEINLSKLDGFSLKKQLNEKTKYTHIPFIFLSHMKNEALIERANRLNVNYFLKKPFYMVELIGLVKRTIR